MANAPIRILGLDPGLQHTGWGLVEHDGFRLRFCAEGVISTKAGEDLPDRLLALHHGLAKVIAEMQPDEAAVENTYVARNPESALKLGQARGVVLLAPALAGLPTREYGAMEVKRAVVGNGHADKVQVQAMVRQLLPGVTFKRADAADALAIAICHAHHRSTRVAFAKAAAKAGARA
ncbi:MAG: crossover junction endodeoxyribonuclease RuvC [Roseomonas sp.]|jgi:crossover junction endodeoxyribonuclease RuvC|nr:crossover junction endodeoxyribonuclease RuvC [Roseomonas sp.]